MAGKYTPLDLQLGDTLTEPRADTYETQYKYAKERSRPLGGQWNVGTVSEDWEDITGHIVVELIEETAVKVHAMCYIGGGSPSGSPGTVGAFRLWNITDGIPVASSEVSFTETTPTLKKSGELVLGPAKAYKVQVRISDPSDNAIVYGANMVTQ